MKGTTVRLIGATLAGVAIVVIVCLAALCIRLADELDLAKRKLAYFHRMEKPTAYLNRGNALHELGEYDLAANEFGKALEACPEWPLAQENLDETLRMAHSGARLDRKLRDTAVFRDNDESESGKEQYIVLHAARAREKDRVKKVLFEAVSTFFLRHGRWPTSREELATTVNAEADLFDRVDQVFISDLHDGTASVLYVLLQGTNRVQERIEVKGSRVGKLAAQSGSDSNGADSAVPRK